MQCKVELGRTHDAWLSILCFNREVKRPSSAVIVTTDHELRVKICGETRKRCESTSLGLEKTSHRALLYDNHIGRVVTHVLHTKFQILLKHRNMWSFLPRDKSPSHFCNAKEREREKGQSWDGEGRESSSEPGSPLQPTAEGHWSFWWSWRQLPAWLFKALEQAIQAKAFCSLCSAVPLQSQPTACSMLWVPFLPQPSGKFVICVSLQPTLKLDRLPFSLEIGMENTAFFSYTEFEYETIKQPKSYFLFKYIYLAFCFF